MKNTHKVPKKQWKKWPDIGKMVFNEVYETMSHNAELFTHPKTGKLVKEQWDTVAWNSAWIAADATVNALNEIAAG